jgi:hypothetical protein
MRQDFGWDKSALQYEQMYREVLGLPLEEAHPEIAEPSVVTSPSISG